MCIIFVVAPALNLGTATTSDGGTLSIKSVDLTRPLIGGETRWQWPSSIELAL
jgi:hypothetical protein